MGGNETMTEKRFTLNYEINNYEDFMVKDNQKEKILYDEDIEKLLNEQDQKIKAIEKLLDNELKKAFNNRINHDDYAEDAELAEYFKGYHCGVGDLEKKIKHILFNK